MEQEGDDAAVYGLFDVPFMVADSEAFFRVDRTEFLDRFLSEKTAGSLFQPSLAQRYEVLFQPRGVLVELSFRPRFDPKVRMDL